MQYFKTSLFILLLTAGIGCGRKNAADLSADRALNAAVEASNRTIQSQTRNVYAALAVRLSDPSTRAKAEVWNPKAEQVRKMSENCYNFLEHLKDDLKAASGIGDSWKGDSVIDLSSKSTAGFFDSGEKEKALISTLKKYEADLLNIE